MGDEVRTAAEVTVEGDAGTEPTQRVLLLVYDEGEAERSRVMEVPAGTDVVIGRSRSTTLPIESERVSRRHARIYRRGLDVVVEDLDSRNGTLVNGVPITGSRRLTSGDRVGVGPAILVVNVTGKLDVGRARGTSADLDARLAAECDRGVRYSRQFALVALHLGGSAEAVAAAIERIGLQLRPMDLLVEDTPAELLVLIPEAHLTAAGQVASRLLEVVRTTPCRQFGGSAPTARAGAAIFPVHGTRPGELVTRARAALRRARFESTAPSTLVTPPAEPARADDDIVIASAAMRGVLDLVGRVAPSTMTVLVVGETGTGKELVAEQIHRQSPRRKGPLVRLNCAAIPEPLLESQLFGHEKGAFTGADRRSVGFFEAADRGTLFLDEIGELPPALQVKLLRVLQEKRFTRVGATDEIAVDVRVVCATNRDLDAESRRGSFRSDLFFRISAFTILVPPLRDRPDDIAPLADRFLTEAAAELRGQASILSDPARQLLEAYRWPGNVRELRNAMERAVVVQTGGVIEAQHLPETVRQADAPLASEVLARGAMPEQIANLEREAIIAALDEVGGNQTRAARALGISRRTLIYKLEKYGLKAPPGKR